MKAKCRFGFVLLLAAVVLLSDSGACAAIQTISSHPCCPQEPIAQQNPPDCCVTAGIPVSFAAVLAWTNTPCGYTVGSQPVPVPSRLEETGTARQIWPTAHTHRFVLLHVFLI